MFDYGAISWLPLTAGLTVVGLALTWLAWRRSGAAAGLRRDLDEVELGLLREPQGVLDTHDADLLAVRADESYLRDAYPVVHA